MAQTIHRVPRADTLRRREPIGRDELIRRAPTEPEAFLQWGAQLEREEGKFELSHGQVTCDVIWTSRHHARICTNIVVELSRLLDRDTFDVGANDFAVQTLVGVRSPDIVVDRTTRAAASCRRRRRSSSPRCSRPPLRARTSPCSSRSTAPFRHCRPVSSARRMSRVPGFGQERRTECGRGGRWGWSAAMVPSHSAAWALS